ncbi:MAG: CBS domain-containing protein [Nitrospirae bacterium]|nr:CBS domain-containing protein [Nitrospirota bacterium]
MYVRRYMTSPAVTIDENATLTEAIHSLKEHGVRRLPVVRKGKLVGILSDRDIKEYCPTKATSLDVWEVHHVLAKVAVREAMTGDPVTIRPDAPIEDAARVLHEKGIGALPVVDAKGSLVGILTEHDVFGALVALTGARRGKTTRLHLTIPDRPGTIREVADVIRAHGGRLVSILTSYEGIPDGSRELAIRFAGGKSDRIAADLRPSHPDLDMRKG